jgi:di/tricarboxylate transporter
VSLDAWLTLAVVLVTLVVLATELLPPAMAVLGAVTALLVLGVIDIPEAFAGFSNPAPLTVAALYVVAAAVQKSGLLERLAGAVLGGASEGGSERLRLARVLTPVAGSSAFLNNTPIVAMVAPAILTWARRTGESASRYLLPVSFATILGGLITVIGTSTNLVVSGLLESHGEAPLGFFEIGKVGLPVAIAGLAMMILLTPLLLPVRRAPSETVEADAREFTVEMIVADAGPAAGQTVSEAGLRNLQGVYLVEIERDGRKIAPVAPDEVLVDGDRLTFAGNVDRVLDLQALPGLVSAEEPHFDVVGSSLRRRLFEAVVASASALDGATLKEVGFRSRYGAAVLAVHRAGERMPGKLGEVRLRAGDVLLLLADSGARRRLLADPTFVVVSPLAGEGPPRREKAPLVAVVVLVMLVLAATGVLDILVAALLAGFALVALRVLTAAEARASIDLNIIVLIAASFGLGNAIETSGLASQIADLVVGPLGDYGDVGLLLGVLVSTTLLTELITNNAAAVLMFPIALATATQAGLDPRPFAIAIAVAASSSFLTPIGYQTNTMVYGMGGYRFADFARVGAPLTIVVLVVATLVIPVFWPLD